ncbi:unnamed protein product [Lactuca saligna]|uniref:Uncharacterized protein n=1 Tax=Lactuca saligna TaxID=75948 RepID=A0AA35YCG9_LACSI|nr:unnamed protein product [Lactuca saligna]
MGFVSLLNIDMDSTSGLLNYYLLDQYDPQCSRLVLENFVITITKETMHDMLGLPKDGEDFMNMPNCEKDNEILQEWKNQYEKRGLMVKNTRRGSKTQSKTI